MLDYERQEQCYAYEKLLDTQNVSDKKFIINENNIWIQKPYHNKMKFDKNFSMGRNFLIEKGERIYYIDKKYDNNATQNYKIEDENDE